jgi:predicted amidophosphoribosyltransferase
VLLDLLAPPRCLACGAPGADLCGGCRRALPFLARARGDDYAPVAYEGPARALVVALKFRNHRRAARVMAAHIVANAPPGFFGMGVLVPAPAHAARVRRRGHDQAMTLALALHRRTDLPVARLLQRTGPATRQVGSAREQRLHQVHVVARGPAPPRAILVDDVRTTGATLAACARELREAGAIQVLTVTYARTL